MKICQVISSNLPILPPGERRWGATELITYEYVKYLRILGHDVDLLYLNDVIPENYDVIHIHVANLCLEAASRGIPYVYSTHDHHSYHFGKNSRNFGEQLEAIKNSIFSIAPAEYVVDYFDKTDKLFYLRHGVDTKYYTPSIFDSVSEFKLLMCANNGVAGDYGADRKGFRQGIEAAKRLKLPITVIGADSNKKFFEIHSDLLEYDKLNVIDNNPTESVKLEYFKSHHIFLHPSNLEYGHPNLTICEAASCCLPIVGTYKGSKTIHGLQLLIDINTDSVVRGIEDTIRDYDKIRESMFAVRNNYDWIYVLKELEKMYKAVCSIQDYNSETVKNMYIDIYNNSI